MRRIKMRETKYGSSDGINRERFKRGQVYTVSDRLGDNFVNQQRVAVDFEEKADDTVPENKAKKRAPRNKSLTRKLQDRMKAI